MHFGQVGIAYLLTFLKEMLMIKEGEKNSPSNIQRFTKQVRNISISLSRSSGNGSF
jgi:hypothetical protein